MSAANHTENRCFKEIAEASPSLFQNGKVVLQAYHVGWIISGSLALVAVIVSFWLISKHLHWYTNKREQRYIVRLLFMVPLYSLISFTSFLFWNHSTPIIMIRDAYEAIMLTAFFYLILMYTSHDFEEQKRVFLKAGLSVEADEIAREKGLEIQKWVFPLGFIKWKPKDGLYFLQLMKWGVLQYCVIRPTTTLAAVILNYIGLYCESSWGLGWGHIYITIIVSLSVTIAMYCLIQLYVPVAKKLAIHKPLLKLFAVKAVVFLTFWQATFLSMLSMFGIIKDSKYMTAEDINIGIGAVLETFEMMIFAFLHLRAFTYRPYVPAPLKKSTASPPSQTPAWRSLGHAMDFRETFREIWIGTIYMFDKIRGKQPKPDLGIIREGHYESAFGRQRPLPGRPRRSQLMPPRKGNNQSPVFPVVEIEVDQEFEIDGHKQWLSLDKYDRFNRPKRDRSEGLQEQIAQELEKRGYPKHMETEGRSQEPDSPSGGHQSWWRNIYNRVSQSGRETEEATNESFTRRKSSQLRHYLRKDNQLPHPGQDINDRPPPGRLPATRADPLLTNDSHDYDRHQFLGEMVDLEPLTLNIGLDSRELRHSHDRPYNISPPVSNADRFLGSIVPGSSLPIVSSSHKNASTFGNGPSTRPRQVSPTWAYISPQVEIQHTPPIRGSLALHSPVVGPQPDPRRRPYADPYSWSPPSTSPNLDPHPSNNNQRAGTHRREPAALADEDETRGYSRERSPSARVRYPGLDFPSGSGYIPVRRWPSDRTGLHEPQ